MVALLLRLLVLENWTLPLLRGWIGFFNFQCFSFYKQEFLFRLMLYFDNSKNNYISAFSVFDSYISYSFCIPLHLKIKVLICERSVFSSLHFRIFSVNFTVMLMFILVNNFETIKNCVCINRLEYSEQIHSS